MNIVFMKRAEIKDFQNSIQNFLATVFLLYREKFENF